MNRGINRAHIYGSRRNMPTNNNNADVELYTDGFGTYNGSALVSPNRRSTGMIAGLVIDPRRIEKVYNSLVYHNKWRRDINKVAKDMSSELYTFGRPTSLVLFEDSDPNDVDDRPDNLYQSYTNLRTNESPDDSKSLYNVHNFSIRDFNNYGLSNGVNYALVRKKAEMEGKLNEIIDPLHLNEEDKNQMKWAINNNFEDLKTDEENFYNYYDLDNEDRLARVGPTLYEKEKKDFYNHRNNYDMQVYRFSPARVGIPEGVLGDGTQVAEALQRDRISMRENLRRGLHKTFESANVFKDDSTTSYDLLARDVPDELLNRFSISDKFGNEHKFGKNYNKVDRLVLNDHRREWEDLIRLHKTPIRSDHDRMVTDYIGLNYDEKTGTNFQVEPTSLARAQKYATLINLPRRFDKNGYMRVIDNYEEANPYERSILRRIYNSDKQVFGLKQVRVPKNIMEKEFFNNMHESLGYSLFGAYNLYYNPYLEDKNNLTYKSFGGNLRDVRIKKMLEGTMIDTQREIDLSNDNDEEEENMEEDDDETYYDGEINNEGVIRGKRALEDSDTNENIALKIRKIRSEYSDNSGVSEDLLGNTMVTHNDIMGNNDRSDYNPNYDYDNEEMDVGDEYFNDNEEDDEYDEEDEGEYDYEDEGEYDEEDYY